MPSKSKKSIYLLLLFVSILKSYGQRDTLFIVFPETENYNSLNTKIVTDEDYYTILHYNFQAGNNAEPFYSLLRTNYNGEIEKKLEVLSLDNTIVRNITHFQSIAGEYLCFANIAQEESENLFVSFKIDAALENIVPIDTIFLLKDEALYFRKFNFNHDTQLIEGFGELKTLQTNTFKSSVYVSADEAGYFKQKKMLKL